MYRKLNYLQAVTGTVAAVCFAASLTGVPTSHAADATNAPAASATVTNPPPKVKHWANVAAAAATLTSGNSKSFLATITIDSKAKYDHNEYLLYGAAGYGENTAADSTGKEVTNKTQDYLKGGAQWNHLFSDRFYAGLKLDGVHDDIARIQYRFIVSPLAGYYFLKYTNTTLSGEVGPSYVYQKLDDNSPQSYAAVRVGERFEHHFKAGAKAWETAEWIDQVNKTENWIFNLEVGISAPMSKTVDVRLILDDTFNNQPAPGLLKNDLKLLAGIGYRF